MRPRKGPPLAVIVRRSTTPAGWPASSWCRAVCSEFDGDQLRAGGLRKRADELAADDQRLLVGEREVDALAERRHRRPETGGADERVEHELRAGLDDQLDETLRAGKDLTIRPRLGGARSGVGVNERDPPHAVRAGLCDKRLPGALGGEPDQLELTVPGGAVGGEDVKRLGADRAGGAEDQKTLGHRSQRYWARGREEIGRVEAAWPKTALNGHTPAKCSSRRRH